MIPYLDADSPFPNVSSALSEPNGLLAAGADLSVPRLKKAYAKGIFPWYSEGEPILWWSPNPRMIFELPKYHISRSLIKFIKKAKFTVTLNQAFSSVVNNCAMPRSSSRSSLAQAETWISKEIKDAYIELHKEKRAHSVEVWDGNELVGGIYGVSVGKLFCGESMFSRVSNGSKVALFYLVEYLKTENFPIIDCQVENDHLVSLGAINIQREDYIAIIEHANIELVEENFWEPKTINFNFDE